MLYVQIYLWFYVAMGTLAVIVAPSTTSRVSHAVGVGLILPAALIVSGLV